MSDDLVLLCSSGYDKMIKFWEALSGVCSRTIEHNDGQVNRMVITHDKKYLACAGTHNVTLYDIKSNNPDPVMTFEGHKGAITALALQADSKWMTTSSEDGTVKVWDMRVPSVQRDYHHRSPVNDVVIHPNQGEIVSCDHGGNIRVWDLGENTCTHHLIPEEGVPVRSVSVASNGTTLVAGNNRGNCYVWRMFNSRDVTSLHPITRFRSHSKYITKVLLSPDVKHLATCSADHTTRVWSVEQDFKMESVLRGHQRWVWDAAFTADSAYLVTASSDQYVRLWELQTGQVVRQYRGHQKGVLSVALNDI